jgi:hypothetical protein
LKLLKYLNISPEVLGIKMVHIGEISFCDKVAFNIKSDETKKYILDRIDKQYNLKIITKHFDKFDTRMMPNLNNNPHMLCVRSNGNPYFLYLTKLNFVNYCIFIDKKIQQGYFFPRMIITNYRFDDSLFEDTIFDGEMIKKNGEKWVFILNDLIVHKGVHLSDQNLVKRLNLIYLTLKNEFSPDTMDVSRIQVKKYFKYDEIEKMIREYIPSLPYSCRGVYFKPLFLRFKDVLVNFDDTLVKKVERNKYKHVKNFLLLDDQEAINVQNEVSQTLPSSSDSSIKKFHVRKTNNPDVYELFDAQSVYVDIACIPSLKISKFMRQLFASKNIVDKVELEFEYSNKFNKWVPVV